MYRAFMCMNLICIIEAFLRVRYIYANVTNIGPNKIATGFYEQIQAKQTFSDIFSFKANAHFMRGNIFQFCNLERDGEHIFFYCMHEGSQLYIK